MLSGVVALVINIANQLVVLLTDSKVPQLHATQSEPLQPFEHQTKTFTVFIPFQIIFLQKVVRMLHFFMFLGIQ